VRCPKDNEEKDVIMTREKLENLRCPNDNELYEITAEKDLTDEILKKAESMGTQVEMMSSDTKEGNQLKEMGGIGGILRYKSDKPA
jgi:peptide chain release factor subunit 1